MADRGHDGIDAVAFTALEVISVKLAVGFHMSDHHLDGRLSLQFAPDLADHPALLAGAVDPE